MNPENKSLLRKIFVKEPWENIASAVIIIGVVMLLQPYLMVLYTYSFNFILGGTLTFLIVSHFPSGKS